MRTFLLPTLGLSLMMAGCATRPNRTEPSWKVPASLRTKTVLKMLDTKVDADGAKCAERDTKRAENLGSVVERELYDAGFDFPADDEVSEVPPIDVFVSVRLRSCEEGLLGDIGLTLKDGETIVASVEEKETYFSNLRVGANKLVDRIVSSDELAARLTTGAPAKTATTMTSSVTTTSSTAL